MIQNIILPKQGLQMTEGFITRWLLKEGDMVKEGEPLFEMETDKLVITIDATCSGKLLKIVYPEGSTVPITTVIAYVGEDSDALPEGAPAAPAPVIEAAPAVEQAPAAAAMAPEEKQPAVPVAPSPKSTGRIFATPRARTTAEEKGYDLRQITPTGPDSLIIERDVLGFVPAAAPQLCGAMPYMLSAQISVFSDESVSKEDVVRTAFAKAAEQSGISCGEASGLAVRVLRNPAMTACMFPAAAPQITVCTNTLTLAFYPENADDDAVLAFFELLCMFAEKPWLAAIR